jgi:hypothetical protein
VTCSKVGIISSLLSLLNLHLSHLLHPTYIHRSPLSFLQGNNQQHLHLINRLHIYCSATVPLPKLPYFDDTSPIHHVAPSIQLDLNLNHHPTPPAPVLSLRPLKPHPSTRHSTSPSPICLLHLNRSVLVLVVVFLLIILAQDASGDPRHRKRFVAVLISA